MNEYLCITVDNYAEVKYACTWGTGQRSDRDGLKKI